MSTPGDETRPDDPANPDPIRSARDEIERHDSARRNNPTGTERAEVTIDRYRLIEEIGEGGMGSVWRAEQSAPVRRHVALKIIKFGMDTREVIARFEAERQALAVMDHPYVAKVLDGGSTASGRPYFVMELVDGVPITQHCADHALSLRDRLDLFAKVCDAIQHAHQKGIVHRDIKPSNVLVGSSSHGSAPKVIDFGVAKALNTELTQQTLVTRRDQVMGTPEYMAPEQAAMSDDIDTRADVYSLGALLYELLTGTTPFDLRARIETGGYMEALRTIREEDPPTPSTRLSSIGQAPKAAPERATTPVHWPPSRLRGDLNWIVIKAMDKDRGRRFESASALADDVRRHLADEPVFASPPSRLYQLRKLARRHRAAFVSATIIVLLLIAGLAGATWGLLHVQAINEDLEDAVELAEKNEGLAEQESQRAERELARAREVKHLLSDMLDSATPRVAMGADTELLQDLLGNLATRLMEGEIHDLFVANELHQTVGSAYLALQRYDLAERHLQFALDQARDEWGDLDFKTLLAYINLAGLRLVQQHNAEVLDLLQPRLEAWGKALGEDFVQTIRARVLVAQATANTGRREEAARLLREVISLARRALGPMSSTCLHAESVFAQVLLAQGEYAEAEPLLLRLVEVYTADRGSDRLETLRMRKRLADASLMIGKQEDATEIIAEVIESTKQAFGAGYLDTLLAQASLAKYVGQAGQHDRSREIYEEIVREGTESLGANHEVVRRSQAAIVVNLKDRGRLIDARDYFEPILTEADEESEGLLGLILVAADVYANLRLFDRVTELLDPVWPRIEALRELPDDVDLLADSYYMLRSLTNVGFCLNRDRRFGDARRLLEISFPIKRRKLGDWHMWTINAGRELVMALEGLGEVEAAAAARMDYYACLRELGDATPPPDPALLIGIAWQLLQGPPEHQDPETTIALAEAAVQLSDAKLPRIVATLIEVNARAGHYERALEVFDEMMPPLLPKEPQPIQDMFANRRQELAAALESQTNGEAHSPTESTPGDSSENP